MRAELTMNLEDRLGERLTREDPAPIDPREFEGEPEIVRALIVWNAMVAQLGAQLEESLPDDELLVLCALDASGHPQDLTEEEKARVEAARPAFESACESHPGLACLIANIGRDRDEFNEICDEAIRPRIQRILPRVWRIAAVIAVVGFVGLLAWTLLRQHTDETIVAVAEADREVMELPDGSTVHLVGPAGIRYREAEFDRTVVLIGGGFFDVIDNLTPFVVHTDEAIARVVGTRFGVLDTAGSTEVIVESGRVEVAPEDAPDEGVLLTAGQMSRIAAGGSPTPPEAGDLVEALAWTGMLFFRATPMAEVAERLTGRFGVQVTVEPTLAAEPVTGSFATGDDVEQILSVLATTLNAEVVLSESGWHISAR
ncbi:MAG: DUF4974 domain-containing protein [Bacteroidota bacterium]|nr:DUF4974 domain-containing protein [Bacteroidota bacterium]